MARKPPGAAAPKPTPASAAAPAPDTPAATETAPLANEGPAPPPSDNAPEAAPALEQPAEAPPVDGVKPKGAAPALAESVPDLDDFITGHERAAQAVDLVVTAISHPDAKPRHHAGVYSGFPITTGELLATYSDGSKH